MNDAETQLMVALLTAAAQYGPALVEELTALWAQTRGGSANKPAEVVLAELDAMLVKIDATTAHILAHQRKA